MKKLFFNLSLIITGLMMTGCSEEIFVEDGHSGYNHILKIDVRDGRTAETRTTYDGLRASFEEGDVIGVYAVDENNILQATNIPFTLTSGEWIGGEEVIYNDQWSYYAYGPYVAEPYSTDFTQTGIDNQFALFINDDDDKFHKTDQSTLDNFKASDLIMAKGTESQEYNTILFTMRHKKALACLTIKEEIVPFVSFNGNKPYQTNNKGYYCMKANTPTDIGEYSLTAEEGKVVKCAIDNTDNSYLTFQAIEDGEFSVSNPQGTFYYSKNGGSWTSGTSVSVAAGDMVRWKNNATPKTSSPYGIGSFVATGQYEVGGNPLSLIYGDDFADVTDISDKSFAFSKLFYNNYSLKSAKYLSLPATTLASDCYYEMFNRCTGLTAAPELPATTLAVECYHRMFYGCTGLTTAPELPATTLADYCYYNMFNECTSLATAPELPATTLANYCYYNMFNRCTGLTAAPELPATTLASDCYRNMFEGCSGLTTAPELPATTLANNCYSYMFYGCTGLTTAPDLPATTLANNCYSYMFYGCTSLNYIKAMFTTTPSTSYTSNWVNGVASSGTFVKNSDAEWNVTGTYGIPSGWTVETASK